MATVTLKELLRAMREHPRTIETNEYYFSVDDEDDEDIVQKHMEGQPLDGTKVYACAVGEALYQLAGMSQECVSDLEIGTISYDMPHLYEPLAKCVAGTDTEFWSSVNHYHQSRHRDYVSGAMRYPTREEAIEAIAAEYELEV